MREVAWSPDGGTLASVGVDGTVRLWASANGKESAKLEKQRRRQLTVAWSPDGRTLASAGDDGTVHLWEMASGRERARLEVSGQWVLTVAWSPDAGTVASAGANGTVRLWEAVSGRERAKLEGDGAGVLEVAWSPDGGMLASAGAGGTVHLWEVASGREWAKLEGHGECVRAVAWSPDGSTVATGGDDGTVRLWSVHHARLLATLSAVRDATLVCTSGGFYVLALGSEEPERARLALRHPEGQAEFYLPIGGLSEILQREDKVAAALAGDLSGDDASAELERLGLGEGAVWRGEAVRLTSEPTPLAVAPAPENSASPGQEGLTPLLKRVKLSNYRSIASCDVELQPLTFLCGPNGAGEESTSWTR